MKKMIACSKNIWKIRDSIESKDDYIQYFVYADMCMKVMLKFLVNY